MGLSCCFSGHRPDKLPFGYDESHSGCAQLKLNLHACVEELVDAGYATFYAGMAQGSDIYFAESVLCHKKDHPQIRFIAVVPYANQEARWGAAYRQRYRSILRQADEVVILHARYRRGCMMQRNRYMVDRSSLLVAVYSGESGGTMRTLQYAAAKGLRIVCYDPVSGRWTD